MTGRYHRDDHVYDGDPGPAPGSTPPCPICPADKPHQVKPTPDVPDSFLCDGCGFVLTPHVGGDNARRREMWAEENKKRPA
jgi:hypothetical protein